MSLLIKNAQIIDGSGAPPFTSDLLIEQQRISKIAPKLQCEAKQILDAQGLWLTPGFIDVHSHTDLAPFIHQGFKAKALQGITTELTGPCGLGVAPLDKALQAEVREQLIIGNGHLDWHWDDLPSYFQSLQLHGLELNLSPFLPHGLLRYQICQGDSSPMNAKQRSQLAELADQGLRDGARGISLGLIYHPALFANRQELLTLAQVAGEHNKPLVVHMRSESDEIIEALQEMIALSKEAGCQLHISHLKLIGRRNASKLPRLLELIDQHQLTFDQYPYHYGSTTLFSILPPALLRRYPMSELLEQLKQPGLRQEVKAWFTEQILPEAGEPWDNLPALLGWDNILISEVQSQASQCFIGLNVLQCAELTGQDATEFVLDLLIAERGNVRMIDYFMEESLVEQIFQHPRGMIGTDTLLGGQLHPRVHGSFPRILHQFVQQKKLLPIESAIHKMTGLSASTFNIKERGLIKEGYKADLALFGSDFKDQACIETPDRAATGLNWLWVNGSPKVAAGVYLDSSHGEGLKA